MKSVSECLHSYGITSPPPLIDMEQIDNLPRARFYSASAAPIHLSIGSLERLQAELRANHHDDWAQLCGNIIDYLRPNRSSDHSAKVPLPLFRVILMLKDGPEPPFKNAHFWTASQQEAEHCAKAWAVEYKPDDYRATEVYLCRGNDPIDQCLKRYPVNELSAAH